jgi:hypothetical protein
MMQRKSGASGCLEPITDDPPSTIRTAGEIGSIMLDEMARRRRPVAAASTQKLGTSQNEPRRIAPFREQFLRSMEVGEHKIEEPGALRDAALDRSPLGGRKQQWDRVEDPWPRIERAVLAGTSRSRGIEIERDPVILEMLA